MKSGKPSFHIQLVARDLLSLKWEMFRGVKLKFSMKMAIKVHN